MTGEWLGWWLMSSSLCGPVSHFRVSRLLSLVFCRTLQYHKGSTGSTVTRLVFPTAAEPPSSPGEDLAGSIGCDRHTAVQRRLDIMEEVRGAREEGIVMFHWPSARLEALWSTNVRKPRPVLFPCCQVSEPTLSLGCSVGQCLLQPTS